MRRFLAYLLLLFPILGSAQQYKREWLAGYGINTHGIALHFKKYGIREPVKNVLGPDMRLEIGNLTHPREVSVINSNVSNGSTYKFAKVNYTWLIRPSMEGRLVLAKRTSRKSIGVNGTFGVGVPIAYSWPIFVKMAVYDSISKSEDFKEVQYDPEIHPQGAIGGKSSWTRGFGLGDFLPGLSLQMGFEFKTGDFSDEFKIMGMGFRLEAFAKKIPTYYKSTLNQWLISSFYLNFGLGGSK